jgi:hypothetical protein
MAEHNLELASFVAWVDPELEESDLINYLKSLTWTYRKEHAVVEVRGGQRAIICGGAHDIVFEVRQGSLIDPFGRQEEYACIDVNGQPVRVDKLLGHTHPAVTGPSPGDFEMPRFLRQTESIIYEINGPAEGTRFFLKHSKNPNAR